MSAAQPLPNGGAVAFAQLEARPGGPYLRQLARTTAIQPSDEIRALWVVRDALATPEDIDRCVDLAVQARFHILFVQVRGRADALYLSTLEPPSDVLKRPVRDFDPLAYILARAHAAGMSVHAWVNVFYVWSNGDASPPDGHLVIEHPEWLAFDAVGRRMDERPVADWLSAGIEGYFVSPFSAGARAHTAAVIGELVDRYAVDGIHLDYIRFPGPEYGYGAKIRTDFALEWGVDPAELLRRPAELAASMGARPVGVLDSVWVAWRAQHVDSMVLAVRSVVGDLPLSAAVIPDPAAARREKGQDWAGWIQRRWVDFTVPMAYNYRPEEMLDWVRLVHNAIGRERMLVGLALHGGRDRYLDRAVNILRVDRVSGFCLFSYNILAERRFAAAFVESVFFPQEADTLEDEP